VTRALVVVLAVAAAGCAVKAGAAASECTFASDAASAEFCASARDLGATSARDAEGLHIRLNGEAGHASAFAKSLMARESSCCPHLAFRFEQTEDVNILHVSSDKNPGALDRIERLLHQR
jgi:hypothetical protein